MASKRLPSSPDRDSPPAPRLPRKQAVLKASALQDAIFNSANFSCIATDEKGVIQIFNVGAERMLGYVAAEVVNRITPADISDPLELVARAAALSTELSTVIAPGFEALVFKASRGIEDIYDLTYIRKNGSRLPALVSVTALRDAGTAIIGYLLIGTDNTARKHVEAEQKKLDFALHETNLALESSRAAAERANLAKSDFLSSMSHELRSPLNAILGFSQLIETGPPEPTPSQKESVGQILQAGWYLLELINEILDLSLIESGKLSLSLESMSLSDVMRDCQAMIEPQAHQSGIRMQFNFSPGNDNVRGDRTRVKQISINLLSNAIKYNRPGGTVEVGVEALASGRVRVSFRDTGLGLSEEQIKQLFQPFNRLGQESGVKEGTGIGLVVSKRLVELMGGAIGVKSTVGVGSEFWIELDSAVMATAHDDEHASEWAVPANAADAPAYTLLYVEDNPANLLLIKKIMARRTDIKLFCATNGIDGVEMALRLRPDVILMDINLPGLSGMAALQLLQSDETTASIRVIALSANAMARDIEKGLEAGFFRYLTKPIKVDELMATLSMALEPAPMATNQNGIKAKP